MQRIGAALWPKLPCLQIYGANTNVGKTIVSTLLCSALSKKKLKTHYLKPVSTGPLDEADNSHVTKYVRNVSSRTLFQFSRPLSPHLAVRLDGKELPDKEIQLNVHRELASYAEKNEGVALVETAGGVLSPGPSGTLQADLYRPLRLPVLLVGDHHLGGIATSISAFESLHLRGYDLSSVILFEDDVYKNIDYLREYFEKKDVQIFGIPPPPEQAASSEDDAKAMESYYDTVSESEGIQNALNAFTHQHEMRLSKLQSMANEAHRKIWYPFTQHQGRTDKDIMVIDSAYADDFAAVKPSFSSSINSNVTSASKATEQKNESILQPAMDASASWWTQGLGHGNPNLALAAAYAAGRYGHVMFASAINQPSIELTKLLLEGHQNPRLSKVYFTDNGSTGMEVAIKMALRASCQRYDWDHKKNDIEILGLRGSYHGDTMGVMDASEPSTYNTKVEWYRPRGYWFDFPQIKMRNGSWVIEPPPELEHVLGPPKTFSSLDEIMDLPSRGDNPVYTEYIESVLTDLVEKKGHKFGALVMEPLLLGAGGMLFVDPLFQRQLIRIIREKPELINPFTSSKITIDEASQTNINWSGMPVVFDEVFTGLYRLGRFNCNDWLHECPDIVVNAKLLTGGLVPLCTTSASDAIFEAFLSKDKADALLHGHSYTAHAVGCNVAVESLKMMKGMDEKGSWNEFKQSWLPSHKSLGPFSTEEESVKNKISWSMWSNDFVSAVSYKDSVDHVIALGNVLGIALKDEAGAGYESNAAQDLYKRLLQDKDGWAIHSRVLGNVIYFMSSQTSTPKQLKQIQDRLLQFLD